MYTIIQLPPDTGPESYSSIANVAIRNVSNAKNELSQINSYIKDISNVPTEDDLMLVEREMASLEAKLSQLI